MRASAERIRLDVETVARCSSSGPGTNRLSFTPEYWAAVDYVGGQMEALGYERRTTVHGNTRFRRQGSDWTEPAVAVGSHLDAVPRGGRFDGVAGVVAGVEIARLLGDTGAMSLGRPFEVIVFAEEEGARFGSVLAGSRAFTGRLTDGELAELRDKDGASYLEALGEKARHCLDLPGRHARGGGLRRVLRAAHRAVTRAGSRAHPDRDRAGDRGPPTVQGHVLGRGESRRGDADAPAERLLAAAAQAISSVEALATGSATGVTVGTVGMLLNEPNAANVIPSPDRPLRRSPGHGCRDPGRDRGERESQHPRDRRRAAGRRAGDPDRGVGARRPLGSPARGVARVGGKTGDRLPRDAQRGGPRRAGDRARHGRRHDLRALDRRPQSLSGRGHPLRGHRARGRRPSRGGPGSG